MHIVQLDKNINVLLIGSGGREHALYWKMVQSPSCNHIDVLPGNGAIPTQDTITGIDPLDFIALRKLVTKNKYDLIVVGPEDPLVAGITDALQDLCPIFGPSKKASQLEGSKDYSKAFMEKYKIPTANYATFTDFESAFTHIQNQKPPFVIKTDGLAAGKGVTIAPDLESAKKALKEAMLEGKFGDSGKKIVIEEFMEGEETSIFALCDGTRALPFLASQDHKRAFDNDTGPNTGGMGAYLPVPFVTEAIMQRVQTEVLNRALEGMKSEGHPYRGLLYAGLMIKDGDVKVVEFNIRFGDPETQALMRLIEDDLLALLYKSAIGDLPEGYEIQHSTDASIVVVLASKGYPGSYEKNILLKNIDNTQGDIISFHAGTKQTSDGLRSSGGRVLGITATASTLDQVRNIVYADIENHSCDGLFYRKDIGAKGLT